MTTFDERERAFETKYAHDEEMRFKLIAKRNVLFGRWVGEQLGKTGDDLEAYAKSVVVADLEEAGDDDIFRKVEADLKDGGITIDRVTLKTKLSAFLQEVSAD